MLTAGYKRQGMGYEEEVMSPSYWIVWVGRVLPSTGKNINVTLMFFCENNTIWCMLWRHS